MDNPEEMNTFLEKYNPPILNQEEIKNTNKSIISNEIKLVITKKQKTTLNKQKSRTRWLHWWISPNIHRIVQYSQSYDFFQ